MQTALDTFGKIARYAMALLACVWFSQSLLLLNVHTQGAQTLAGETLLRAIFCGAIAGFWFYRASKEKRLPTKELTSTKLAQAAPYTEPAESEPRKTEPSDMGPPKVQPRQLGPPSQTQATPRPTPEQEASLNREFRNLMIALGGIVAAIILLIFLASALDKNGTSNPGDKRQVAQNPLDALRAAKPTAVKADAQNILDCPSAIPAGVKTRLLSPEEMNSFVGTKATLNSGISEISDDDYLNGLTGWEANLKLSNGTTACISSATVEITLQHGESFFTERHSVSFKPILAASHEDMERIVLQKRTKKNGEPLSIQEWHVSKVWGFNYPTTEQCKNDPFKAFGGHTVGCPPEENH